MEAFNQCNRLGFRHTSMKASTLTTFPAGQRLADSAFKYCVSLYVILDQSSEIFFERVDFTIFERLEVIFFKTTNKNYLYLNKDQQSSLITYVSCCGRFPVLDRVVCKHIHGEDSTECTLLTPVPKQQHICDFIKINLLPKRSTE